MMETLTKKQKRNGHVVVDGRLRRALQFVYDLADEMSYEGSYAMHDETGLNLGRKKSVVDELERVRAAFRLRRR